MISRKTTEGAIPEFTFVCGAVGSGNTFMFNCLTQDENVYGVNEDALGSAAVEYSACQIDENPYGDRQAAQRTVDWILEQQGECR